MEENFMKLLKWLKNCSGKMALSALQTAGIATVVGVAGLGAYSFLSSPADDYPSSPSSYNPGEVVYVAGNPNSGVYQSGSYTTGLDTGSEVNTSSAHFTAKTLSRLEQQENRERAMAEMAEYEESNRPSASSVGTAYRGGATEGLGMGANVAHEMGLKGTSGMGDDPMAAISGMMGNVQGMMSQAQQQAQAVAQGKDGKGKGGDAPAVASLKSATMASPVSSSTNGGSNGFNSTFAIQNSGKNKGSSAADNTQDVAGAFAAAQAQMNAAMEGARMQAKSSFGKTDGLGKSKEANVVSGGVASMRNSKGGKDLEYIMKHSNKVAMNKHRAATDGSDPFLSDTKISGGMRIEAENVTTGQGAGSKDFESDATVALRGIGSWKDTADVEEQQREKDRNSMKTWFWIALGVATASSILIPILKPITILGIPVGYWLALALAVVSTIFCAVGFMKSLQFAQRWGKSGFSTMGMIATPLLTASVWVSFFLSHGAAKAIQAKAGDLLGVAPEASSAAASAPGAVPPVGMA